jgi:hypothetical protein
MFLKEGQGSRGGGLFDVAQRKKVKRDKMLDSTCITDQFRDPPKERPQPWQTTSKEFLNSYARHDRWTNPRPRSAGAKTGESWFMQHVIEREEGRAKNLNQPGTKAPPTVGNFSSRETMECLHPGLRPDKESNVVKEWGEPLGRWDQTKGEGLKPGPSQYVTRAERVNDKVVAAERYNRSLEAQRKAGYGATGMSAAQRGANKFEYYPPSSTASNVG